MKKVIVIICLLVILGFGGYFVYVNYFGVDKITPEEELAHVSEYYIYGDHLNIKGSLETSDMTYENITLTLYDGEDNDIDIISDNDGSKIEFYFSEYINDGFYLDSLERGNYYLFLKLTYKNEEDEDKPIIKYYVLDNNTDYKETIYYTMSKFNNKIVINSDNEYGTMTFNVKENKDKEIYDITIDPGHGGMDSGGTAGEHNESYYTMIVSNKIKENLKVAGFKVKLTHEEGELTRNDLLDNYNEHGRAVIPNEVKSKYTFSIHFNKNTSSKVSGFEIYTPANINYDFAKILADSIIEYTDLGYSTNKLYKYYNGIYSRNFNDNDIASSLTEYENKGYAPYNVTTNSNYYFMIRETGGFMTGAYVDNSNLDKVGVNPYYNSNVGNETYLLELGYLSNPSNLDIISSDYDAIAKAVSEAIIAKFSE